MIFNHQRDKNRQRGFTLVEMLVSVSIFVIVAFIVVSTLLTMSYAYKRAQKMRLLMDNLGFSIQSMSLNLREGVAYTPSGCSISSNSCISFNPLDSWLSERRDPGDFVCYDLYWREDSLDTYGIKKCPGTCPCNSSGSDIISSEINITKLSFEISGDSQKKLVKILINGEAGMGREYTDFFIQNSVSQRNVD
ncbi:MAG: hypothetical protein COV08_00215 [Candidatus Vogelbacteria bacterium CG10_big_fil_rev_8_21_14_0_10_49_38]|uniref:Type II secretion system protein n=1 Tax=Candidatus Vogelbacteria bacterium CG10_big_fil_rev_8_21_14_0_10_49_38 TaxID=1975043 RepID=A0A2H0RIV6_9BACT|nr:MAG: hypothetical protein BK006_00215 [bacterium CG10_49_38]PIR46346.1 MAG: hypothetical protein COV08_00215 [Candidatus Vogelbacteria bacterium CG10_big_fil_rev_8_21_14_0_10_49_38]